MIDINKKYYPYIIFLVCLITRLVFFGKYIDDWDGVNFAFALSQGYDVLNDQPHFQGYPVYMFVSWIIYNILHSDINALVLSGIIFSSIAVIPFYAFVLRMFSLQIAILASALYIINPQIWLQSEKALSDAFGLFFVITFAYFLYRSVESDSTAVPISFTDTSGVCKTGVVNCQPTIITRQSLMCLFLGSLTLGLGIGVRISYMAFLITWGFVVFIVCKRISLRKGIFYGFGGLGLGVIAWLGYLVGRFGIINYLDKFASHSNYHFTDESYSILTSTDYVDRLMIIFKNITAHSLGVYWFDTPLIRILPTAVILIAVITYLIKERLDFKNKFLLISIGSYIVWLITVQTAIRHTMVLAPFVIILVSAGIFYFVKSLKTKERQRRWLMPLMLFFIIAPMSFDSGRLVWVNRVQKPPQVALVEYIRDHYDKDSSKFYCLNTWRLFQYYAPEWRDKWNRYVFFTSNISKAESNLRGKYPKPANVLISSKLYGRNKYNDRLRRVKVFERDNYAVAEYNRLALYEFDLNNKPDDKRLSKN